MSETTFFHSLETHPDISKITYYPEIVNYPTLLRTLDEQRQCYSVDIRINISLRTKGLPDVVVKLVRIVTFVYYPNTRTLVKSTSEDWNKELYVLSSSIEVYNDPQGLLNNNCLIGGIANRMKINDDITIEEILQISRNNLATNVSCQAASDFIEDAIQRIENLITKTS